MEQNGNTKKEGLYFMRKKWEIEEEYRNFCRNNKELALQTLRELTLTPTETGKEDQRIAYCMEWMKQQGMESVHTDELGNVIWEYRPEQEKKVLYTAHLDAGGAAGDQRRRNDLALSRHHRRYRECCDASDGGKIRS